MKALAFLITLLMSACASAQANPITSKTVNLNVIGRGITAVTFSQNGVACPTLNSQQTCTINGGTGTANTKVADITVTTIPGAQFNPSTGGGGSVTLSGSASSSFAVSCTSVSACSLMVGSSDLPLNSYAIAITVNQQ